MKAMAFLMFRKCAPEPHRRHNGREVVIEQDKGCRLACDIRTPAPIAMPM